MSMTRGFFCIRARRASLTLAFGSLASVLSACGSGSSGTVPTSPAVTGRFAVPQALHRAVPPAPPNVIPRAPADVRHAAQNVIPRRPLAVRAATATASPNPIVRFSTTEGDIDVELHPDAAPKNVANFLSYVNSGAYTNSFIHRSVSNFVIQGGGYIVKSGQVQTIPQQPAVVNEFDLSNVRGTLAMAKAANDPNSATSQWFFNEVDNSSTLDTQNGGSTVIGTIVSSTGLSVMDAIGVLQIVDDGSPFDMLPVVNYSGGNVTPSNLVNVSTVAAQPSHPSFFDGEQSLGNGVYYLAFPSGNYFGYYSYLSDPHYIYHFDLGYEYVYDAADGQNGVYLYDFQSGHFFYSSPAFPFPYLYDFTLKSTLYYYPDPNNAGRYNSNGTRYFYDFNTGTIITQ